MATNVQRARVSVGAWTIVTAVTFVAVGLSGCGLETQPSAGLYDVGAATPRQIFVALGDRPSNQDPGAFRLFAASPLTLAANSVFFCFASVERCRSGDPSITTIRGVAQNGTSGPIYVAEKFVHLSDALPVTLMATDQTTGRQLAELVMIRSRGSIGNGTYTDGSTTQNGGSTYPDSSTNPPYGGGATTADCYKGPDDWTCQTELAIANLVNSERQRAGITGTLRFDSHVSYVSRLWSAEQARLGQISHDWFSNGTWKERYRAEFSTEPQVASENVAMAGCQTDPAATAQTFMAMWMDSQGHKDNILRTGIASIGVGISRSSSGSCYATQNFGY